MFKVSVSFSDKEFTSVKNFFRITGKLGIFGFGLANISKGSTSLGNKPGIQKSSKLRSDGG